MSTEKLTNSPVAAAGWLRIGRLSLRQLEVLAVILPMVFLSAVYLIVVGPVHPLFHTLLGFFPLAVILLVAVLAFTRSVFGAVRGLQAEVEELHSQTQGHNMRLMQLHNVNLALTRETVADLAADRIAELGHQLSGACHAHLEVVERDGGTRVVLYPGTDESARGCALEHGLDAVRGQSQGGDNTHMMVVSLRHFDRAVGTLYLARTQSQPPFDSVDSSIANMFGTHAALVIQNDRLYDEVRALAIEKERQALAREMHDSLAQVLSFVNTKAQAVEEYLRSDDSSSARQQMAELSAAARQLYAEIREGISALRVDMSGRTLRQVIDEQAEQFAEASRLSVSVNWTGDEIGLPLTPTGEVQLLRIVQEALANVRRHAAADSVVIDVSVMPESFALTVTDDGRGFDQSRPKANGGSHFGLQTMAERAHGIGGELSIVSRLGEGTRVSVDIPASTSTADV